MGVIRFVWAVTGIRTAPPVRAEEGAGSACRADQSAFMPRLANTAGAGGPARFYAAHKGAEVPMGSGTPCASCNLRKDSPAPAVLARRGMGAGSACRASPAD